MSWRTALRRNMHVPAKLESWKRSALYLWSSVLSRRNACPCYRPCIVRTNRGMALNRGGKIICCERWLSSQVLKLRNSKRLRSRNNRRERLGKKGQQPAVGDVVEGYVRKVKKEFALPLVRNRRS